MSHSCPCLLHWDGIWLWSLWKAGLCLWSAFKINKYVGVCKKFMGCFYYFFLILNCYGRLDVCSFLGAIVVQLPPTFILHFPAIAIVYK